MSLSSATRPISHSFSSKTEVSSEMVPPCTAAGAMALEYTDIRLFYVATKLSLDIWFLSWFVLGCSTSLSLSVCSPAYNPGSADSSQESVCRSPQLLGQPGESARFCWRWKGKPPPGNRIARRTLILNYTVCSPF